MPVTWSINHEECLLLAFAEGEASMDVYAYRATRFGNYYSNPEYAAERTREAVKYYYRLKFPHDESEWARPHRISPVHYRLQEMGAVFGEKSRPRRDDRERRFQLNNLQHQGGAIFNAGGFLSQLVDPHLDRFRLANQFLPLRFHAADRLALPLDHRAKKMITYRRFSIPGFHRRTGVNVQRLAVSGLGRNRGSRCDTGRCDSNRQEAGKLEWRLGSFGNSLRHVSQPAG